MNTAVASFNTTERQMTVLQPLQRCCVDCVIHHERCVRAKNKIIYAWREQAIVREIATHDLYCCLLLRCEALRTCRSGFPIANVSVTKMSQQKITNV